MTVVAAADWGRAAESDLGREARWRKLLLERGPEMIKNPRKIDSHAGGARFQDLLGCRQA